MHQFLKFIFGIKLYKFRTVPLSIIKSFSLYTQQVCWQLASKLSANLYDRHLLLCVQWKTPDDGQRNCPKHIEFYSKNKFEKLVHLVGFVIKTYHDAQSLERQTCGLVTHVQSNFGFKTIQYLEYQMFSIVLSCGTVIARERYRLATNFGIRMDGQTSIISLQCDHFMQRAHSSRPVSDLSYK